VLNTWDFVCFISVCLKILILWKEVCIIFWKNSEGYKKKKKLVMTFNRDVFTPRWKEEDEKRNIGKKQRWCCLLLSKIRATYGLVKMLYNCSDKRYNLYLWMYFYCMNLAETFFYLLSESNPILNLIFLTDWFFIWMWDSLTVKV